MSLSKKLFLIVAVMAVFLAVGGALAQEATPQVTPEAVPTLPSRDEVSLAGANFKVGSKDFSEQIILAYITMDILESYGATTEDLSNIVGSANTRAALVSGEIDMYWEYTGTGWITHLQQTTPIPDPQEQFEAVKAMDVEENGIAWLDPAPFNNTYAFATPRATAEALGIDSLSDIPTLPVEQQTFCIESEFSTRDDGFPGMIAAYGIDVPKENVFMLDTGVIYTQTAAGNTCTFGEVFATDGRIAALDLVVLADDLNFFPVYQPAVTMRQETLDAYPVLADIFAPIAAALSNEAMQALNAAVDVDGEDPHDVATQWLIEQGFISEE